MNNDDRGHAAMTDEETRAAKQRDEQRRQVKTETNGMYEAYAALLPLDYNARRRALRWIGEALENAEPPF